MDPAIDCLASGQSAICNTLRGPVRGDRLMNRLTHEISDTPEVVRATINVYLSPKGTS